LVDIGDRQRLLADAIYRIRGTSCCQRGQRA